MSAIEAVYLIGPHVGGDVAAKLMISERIRDLKLAMAVEWFSEGADVGGLPKSRPIESKTKLGEQYATIVTPENKSGSPIFLGGLFTLSSDNWEKDVERWIWGIGLFVTTEKPLTKGLPIKKSPLRLTLPRRMVAYGVHFRRMEIIQLLPQVVIENKTPPSPAGRKRDVRWNAWVAEACYYIHSNGYPEAMSGSEFARTVVDILVHRQIETLEPGTYESTARAILKRFKSS